METPTGRTRFFLDFIQFGYLQSNLRSHDFTRTGAESFSRKLYGKSRWILLGGEAELFLIPDSQIQVAMDEQAQKRGVFVHQEEGELKTGQQKQKFGRFSDESFGKIQIGIPETMDLNELECSVDAGTCTIAGIYARTMDLSTEVGTIEVRDSKADELDAGAGVGSRPMKAL